MAGCLAGKVSLLVLLPAVAVAVNVDVGGKEVSRPSAKKAHAKAGRTSATIVESSPLQAKSCDSVPGWFQGKDVFQEAVTDFDNGIFVELGPYLGKSSCHMSHLIQDSRKQIEFHVVDSWADLEAMRGWAPKEHVNLVKEHGGTLQDAFLHFMTQTNSIPGIAKMQHGSDTDKSIVHQYKDDSVQFLYMDTDLNYASTKQELMMWWPKIRAGGRMCGDSLTRVKHAVKGFFKALALPVHEQGNDQWCVTATNAFRPSRTERASLMQFEVSEEGETAQLLENLEAPLMRRND